MSLWLTELFVGTLSSSSDCGLSSLVQGLAKVLSPRVSRHFKTHGVMVHGISVPVFLHPQRVGLTKRFSLIAGALDIPGQAIIDGEVVVIHEGRTNFSELQAELAAGHQDRLVYYAFDLLWREGDLRKLPQKERKQTLSDLLGENDIETPVIYSEHLTGDGQEMFEHAAKLGWEGIVSKNAQAPYRSERTEAWLKIKTVQKGEFPVVGFVRDPTGIAALYLGKREGKELVYIGKVGTGWSRTVSSQIRKQLDTVVSPKSKLTKPVKKPKATWVEPSFTAEAP
jgi:bifunctional non-homologous end joining protein LigD